MKEEITAGVEEMKLNIDSRMKLTDDKIENLKKETEINKEKQVEQDNWIRTIESRLNKQEEDIKWTKFQHIKNNKLQQMDNLQTSGSELAEKLAQRLEKHFPKPPIEGIVTEAGGDAEKDREETLGPVVQNGEWGRHWDEQLRQDSLPRTGGAIPGTKEKEEGAGRREKRMIPARAGLGRREI